MALSGTASDDVAVTSVTWVNDRGGSGTATGTTSWSVADCALFEGTNVITVTGHDGDSNTGIDVRTVVYDTVAPTIQITGPTTGPTYSTTNSSLQLGGTASDSTSGLDALWWYHTELDQFGAVSGKDIWTTVSLVLQLGVNTVLVYASDKATNVSSPDTIVITLTTGATFPTTPILFSGTHADENPISVGGNFAGPARSGAQQLKILSNQVVGAGTAGVDRADSYWNTTTTTPIRDEVYCTIATASGSLVELYVRLTNPNSGSFTAYSVRVITTSGGVSTYSYRRFDPGAIVTLKSDFVGPTLADGDKFGIMMDGSHLQAFIRQGTGAWTELDGGAFDTLYPLGTGTLGWRIDPTSPTTAIVDLGGGKGTVPAEAPTTYGPMGSGAW